MTRNVIVMVFCAAIDVRMMKFLRSQRGEDHTLWVLTPSLVRECIPGMPPCEALIPDEAASAIKSWDLFGHVQIADRRAFRTLHQPMACIIMPETEIAKAVERNYLQGYKVIFKPY